MGTSVRQVVDRRHGRSAARSHRTRPTEMLNNGRIRRYGIIYQRQLGRSDCFIVNVRRRGHTYTRRFAFSTHGGLAAALKAAIAWRNTCLAEKPVFTLKEFHDRVRSNNTSGVPGVTFLRPSRQPDGIWQAKLSRADGYRLCRMFSVRKYGFDEAFARAVAARSEFLAALPDQAYLTHPLAKRLSRNSQVSREAFPVDPFEALTGEEPTPAVIERQAK
jgi:hypothetical protein